MPNETFEEYNKKIDAETEQRKEAVSESKTVDELFARTMRNKASLSAEELENYQYYKSVQGKFEEEFKKFSRQWTWGADESKWPKEKREDYFKARLDHKIEYFEDNCRNEYKKDEKFVKGAEIARFVDADKEVLKSAAEMIKTKQSEYNKTSAVGRFFSYINPFSNKYREMRNEISSLKNKVTEVTGCDRKALDDFTDGKTDDISFEKGEVYNFSILSLTLKNANQYKTFGDPFEAAFSDEIKVASELEQQPEPEKAVKVDENKEIAPGENEEGKVEEGKAK